MMMTINALGGRLVFGTLFLCYNYFYSMVLVPPDDDVEVRNIEVGEFAPEKGNSTFSVKFSWTGPAFNFTLYGYHFNYELTGYKKHAITIKGDVV